VPSLLRERLTRHQRAAIKAAQLDSEPPLASAAATSAGTWPGSTHAAPPQTLTSRQLTRSHHAVQTTLGEAIDYGESSFTDNVNQAPSSSPSESAARARTCARVASLPTSRATDAAAAAIGAHQEPRTSAFIFTICMV
jgi:hypothetical protein